MPSRLLNIGQAAARSGLSAKMIRNYEAAGLLPSPMRSASGYRLYGPEAVDTLVFIKGARALGFTLEDVGQLLQLRHDPGRASADVQALVQHHIAVLDQRIESLTVLRGSLSRLAEQCQGNASPECAILDRLSTGDVAASEP